jgi:hypothetical protein
MWGHGITLIPVCFIFTGQLTSDEDSRERALVKEVMTTTWGRWTKIQFTGFGTCPNPPPDATLAIMLESCDKKLPDGSIVGCGGAGNIPCLPWDGQGQPPHRGFQGLDTPTWGVLWISGSSVTDRRARYVIAHEVGHGLSFEHEQSRPDAAGFCPDGDDPWYQDPNNLPGAIVTPEYDDTSIMNYCGPGTYLSRLDIKGAQTLYGKSSAGVWLNTLPAISHLPLL